MSKQFKKSHPVLVLVGPTASGKTEVACCLAEPLHAAIVSADSRQIYKWMNIGTAKPTPAEQKNIPHYFVDLLTPDQEFSAGEYARRARSLIQTLRNQGQFVLVVGGSGMYIQALLDGFFPPAVNDPAIKARLKERVRLEGPEPLYRELEKIDPERAAELHPRDAHRIVRALEVYYVSGQTFTALRRQKRIPAPFPFVQFGLRWPREILYKRIESRVDQMINAGLEREVRALLARGLHPELNALQSVGYREMIAYIRGEMSYADMVAKIKQHTRNFAKRQMTWFRKDRRIHWIDMEQFAEVQEAAARILELYHAML